MPILTCDPLPVLILDSYSLLLATYLTILGRQFPIRGMPEDDAEIIFIW